MSKFRRLYDLCNDPDRLREFAKNRLEQDKASYLLDGV
jgi:hypothetical protein